MDLIVGSSEGLMSFDQICSHVNGSLLALMAHKAKKHWNAPLKTSTPPEVPTSFWHLQSSKLKRNGWSCSTKNISQAVTVKAQCMICISICRMRRAYTWRDLKRLCRSCSLQAKSILIYSRHLACPNWFCQILNRVSWTLNDLHTPIKEHQRNRVRVLVLISMSLSNLWEQKPHDRTSSWPDQAFKMWISPTS